MTPIKFIESICRSKCHWKWHFKQALSAVLCRMKSFANKKKHIGKDKNFYLKKKLIKEELIRTIGLKKLKE